ncbi:uncharacterized protein N0V89_011098 [Didymosphaeria variabile]|uniref:Heterokaryon incompatibility domain-containing protein n=1 Tax=Didymosphaeria variabile TaxID=1932322 RepID=A0A9W8XCJ4_9PLEO|nr:uncharacterized protein N0V89_011098 [Didymosphaeria variabile]KAJ4347160.1 hypothetical protein N0V89_011098 [Didymosphaeria variabile]
MALCTDCSGMSFESLLEGHTHLRDARQLLTSSKTCSLCHLIRLALNRDTVKEVGNDFETGYYDRVAEAPLVLYGVFDEEEEHDAVEKAKNGTKLVGIDVHVPLMDDELDITILGVYPTSTSSTVDLIGGRPSLQEAGSEEAMQLITTWMQDCIHSHPRCVRTTSEPKLPTRVLDLSGESIRLVITQDQQDRYAALSHCWGPNPPLMTKTHNIDSHRMGISFGALPKTFQHAVQIVRRIGLRYLWIDSLCIIQDDKSDWEREAIQMGSVYEGAHVTIAATGSSNAYDGCFIPRPKLTDPVPFNIAYQGTSVDAYAALRPESASADLQSNPLADRAWITQEWLLSRRIIHFARGDLRWICRTKSETETGEAFVDTSGTNRIHRALDTKDQKDDSAPGGDPHSKRLESTNAQAEWDFLDEWLDVASSYCRRKLTYQSDKPIALQGIIDVISRQTVLTCFHGLWDFSIHRQLFWFASHTLTRPPTLAHIPSWSWLSTYGTIQHFTQDSSSELAAFADSENRASVRIDDATLHIYAPTLEHGTIEGPYSTDIPAGEIVYSASTIERIKHVQTQMKPYLSRHRGDWSLVCQHSFGLHDKRGAAIGWFSLDTAKLPDGNMVFVPLVLQAASAGSQANFLVLCKEPGREVWLRIGAGELKDASSLAEAEWSLFQVE